MNGLLIVYGPVVLVAVVTSAAWWWMTNRDLRKLAELAAECLDGERDTTAIYQRVHRRIFAKLRSRDATIWRLLEETAYCRDLRTAVSEQRDKVEDAPDDVENERDGLIEELAWCHDGMSIAHALRPQHEPTPDWHVMYEGMKAGL